MKPQPRNNLPPSSASTGPMPSTISVCRQPALTQREFSVLQHRPDAIEAWVRYAATALPGATHRRCLELAKGPLVYALQKYDFLVLFPVNPAMLAKYRQAFTPSRCQGRSHRCRARARAAAAPPRRAQSAQAAKRRRCARLCNSSNIAGGWSATRCASPTA